MIEAYGVLGYTLWKELPEADLEPLLKMTWELRRDPKERKAERDREEGEAVLQQFLQQHNDLEFTDENNNVRQINFSNFKFEGENGSNRPDKQPGNGV